VQNEPEHARSKLAHYSGCRIEYVRQDATDMKLQEASADVNIMFFLLHELPHHLKIKASAEAGPHVDQWRQTLSRGIPQAAATGAQMHELGVLQDL
jgi:hypothetical protein